MISRMIVFVAALLAPATTSATDAATFRELLIRYRCAVVDRLDSIYEIYSAGDPSDVQDTFLIIYFADHPHDYVQCVFDAPTRMYCEAASGFYDDVETVPRSRHLSAASIAELGRLGFSTDDSAGNFAMSFDVPVPPDLNRIADFMLKALHDGYGARADRKLEFNAPYAPRPTSQCVPVSQAGATLLSARGERSYRTIHRFIGRSGSALTRVIGRAMFPPVQPVCTVCARRQADDARGSAS